MLAQARPGSSVTLSARTRIAPRALRVGSGGRNVHRPPSGRRLQFSVSDSFLLIPVGTGDCGHLDAAVDLPSPVTLGEGKLVIGREASANVNLVLKIPTVSSTHAMIDYVDGEFFVTDLQSTNGTFLNGEELPAGQPVKLTAGAEVIFGDEYLAKFVLEEVQA